MYLRTGVLKSKKKFFLFLKMRFKNVVSLLFVSSFVLTCVNGKRSRIQNGDEAQPGEFPYAVAIIQFHRGYICSGGIIGDKWILSAAHCVTETVENHPFRDDDFSVVAGTNDFASDLDSNFGMEVPVEAIYIPREYKLTMRRADIAVLKLAGTLDFQKYHLQKLILPFDNQNFYEVGTHAVVAGFGAKDVEFIINDNNEKQWTDFDLDGKLRYAEVAVTSNSEFAKIPHDDYELGEYHFLAKMVKESNNPYGMCFGDSGSPVVYQSKIVIGVTVEMFDMCDEREYPTLYTKVTQYLNFVQNAVKDNVTEDIRVKRYQL